MLRILLTKINEILTLFPFLMISHFSFAQNSDIHVDCSLTPDLSRILPKIILENTTVNIVHGGCFLDAPLFLGSNIVISGSENAEIMQNYTLPDNLSLINISSVTSHNAVKNIKISEVHLDGGVVHKGFSEHNHILSVYNAQNVELSHLTISGFRGDGVYLGYGNVISNNNVSINNNIFDGVNYDNRNGISIIDGHNIRIEKNYFTRISRYGMPGSIDIEPNNALQRVNDVVISNNSFFHVAGMSAIIVSLRYNNGRQPVGIKISDNKFNYLNRSIFVSSKTPITATNINNFIISDNFSLNAVNVDYSIYDVNALIESNNPAIQRQSLFSWRSLKVY